MLYDKWWKNDPVYNQMTNSEENGGQSGEDPFCKKRRSGADNMANALGVVNIGGIFVVLLCGLAFAITIAIVEFCWKTSTLNTSPGGVNKIMQTSPNRRNSRRKSTSLKIRTRKSLCAEIAGTLLPYCEYSDKTTSCASKKKSTKKRATNSKISINSQNQTIECNMYDIQVSNSNGFEAINDDVSDHLAVPINNAPRSVVYKDRQKHVKQYWSSHLKLNNSFVGEHAYDDVTNNCRHQQDVPSDEDNYFYHPSTNDKHVNQRTSSSKLKRSLNHSLPSIPPAVPPHANEENINQLSPSHRIYVPSLNR